MRTMLSVNQIAEKYGVTRQAVHGWIRDGLQAQKVKIIGKNVQYMIYDEDVKEYHAKKTR